MIEIRSYENRSVFFTLCYFIDFTVHRFQKLVCKYVSRYRYSERHDINSKKRGKLDSTAFNWYANEKTKVFDYSTPFSNHTNENRQLFAI